MEPYAAEDTDLVSHFSNEVLDATRSQSKRR